MGNEGKKRIKSICWMAFLLRCKMGADERVMVYRSHGAEKMGRNRGGVELKLYNMFFSPL